LASRLNVPVLGELPLLPDVSAGGDEGVPYALWRKGGKSLTYEREGHKMADEEWMLGMEKVAGKVWEDLDGSS
jgi:ATP-binding protein involved in chromosome partitioning